MNHKENDPSKSLIKELLAKYPSYSKNPEPLLYDLKKDTISGFQFMKPEHVKNMPGYVFIDNTTILNSLFCISKCCIEVRKIRIDTEGYRNFTSYFFIY